MIEITRLDIILIPWVVLGFYGLAYLADKYILIPRMKRNRGDNYNGEQTFK